MVIKTTTKKPAQASTTNTTAATTVTIQTNYTNTEPRRQQATQQPGKPLFGKKALPDKITLDDFPSLA